MQSSGDSRCFSERLPVVVARVDTGFTGVVLCADPRCGLILCLLAAGVWLRRLNLIIRLWTILSMTITRVFLQEERCIDNDCSVNSNTHALPQRDNGGTGGYRLNVYRSTAVLGLAHLEKLQLNNYYIEQHREGFRCLSTTIN